MPPNPGLKIVHLTVSVLALAVCASCSAQQPAGGAVVWIDAPVEELSFAEVQPIHIQGHASSPAGIRKVEILVNGELYKTLENPPAQDNLASYEAPWTAGGPGEYTLQAIAYSADGSISQPDTARVRFGQAALAVSPTAAPSRTDTMQPSPTSSPTETATPAPTDSPTPTETSTPTSAPTVTPTPTFTSTATDRPTATPTPTPQPATITNTPVPDTATPTVPPPDMTAPPVPAPAVPANGLSLSCRSKQTLVWLPVTDESGIAEYQVQIERSTDGSTWSKAPGSPKTGLSVKSVEISVECGWQYRWRVRAIDGKGNTSAWSAWSQFSLPLG